MWLFFYLISQRRKTLNLPKCHNHETKVSYIGRCCWYTSWISYLILRYPIWYKTYILSVPILPILLIFPIFLISNTNFRDSIVHSIKMGVSYATQLQVRSPTIVWLFIHLTSTYMLWCQWWKVLLSNPKGQQANR